MKLKWLIWIVSVALGALFYSSLPEQIPIHWNAAGEVDGYGARWTVWILPLVTLGLLLLFRWLPRIDPKKANYQKFTAEYEALQQIIVFMLSFIFLIQLGSGLKAEIADSATRLLFLGMGLTFALLGAIMRGVKQNFFVGIRTPWTLTSQRSWRKTHQLGGQLFMALGLVMIFNSLFDWQNFVALIIGILGTVIFLFVYSYYQAK